MEDTQNYRIFTRPYLDAGDNISEVLKIALQVKDILNDPVVKKDIAKVHQFRASSHNVQSTFLTHMEKLGFASEKKGLFSQMKVSGIRPDYFKELQGGGILFEVERGKTLANNMDLLDVWKTHICREAKHLFLMVPKIRVTEAGKSQKIFKSVGNRIETFFVEQTPPIDVDSIHLFGY